MKVLFLDIDGVLNSNFWNEDRFEISNGNLIDRSKIQLLRDIIKNTGAYIVIHSGWRFWFDNNLKAIRKQKKLV